MLEYDIATFQYNKKPLYLKIGNNYFTKEHIKLDIKEENLYLKGDLFYYDFKYLNNIMGPFKYLPVLECYHDVISMKHKITGSLNFNNNSYSFDNATGYIETDKGTSFPKKYIWCQSNIFKKHNNVSFFMSIADIPIGKINFTGLICSLTINDKKYNFTTYNNSKIIKNIIDKDNIYIVLKKRRLMLRLHIIPNTSYLLLSPKQGEMGEKVYESLNSTCNVVLLKNNKVIFNDTSSNCSTEVKL